MLTPPAGAPNELQLVKYAACDVNKQHQLLVVRVTGCIYKQLQLMGAPEGAQNIAVVWTFPFAPIGAGIPLHQLVSAWAS